MDRTLPGTFAGVFPVESPYRDKIERIGFRFLRVDATPQTNPDTYHIEGRVLCQCGREELFFISKTVPTYLRKSYDLFHDIKESFGPEHLEHDGFGKDVIDRARAVWDEPLFPTELPKSMQDYTDLFTLAYHRLSSCGTPEQHMRMFKQLFQRGPR